MNASEAKDAHWFRTEDTILHFTPDRVRCFEVTSSQPDQLPGFKHDFLNPNDLDGWLQEGAARASDAHSTLRVLMGECLQDSRLDVTSSQYNIIPFSKGKWERVLKEFAVPPQFVWGLEEPSGQVARFRDDKGGWGKSSCFPRLENAVYSRSNHSLCVVERRSVSENMRPI